MSNWYIEKTGSGPNDWRVAYYKDKEKSLKK